ncbi:2-dehydropantoate 2-reductase [Piscinibacter sakaiensis]|nr:2-dehydropantoate 2-reductase [Piscinibacter sakaiensis]
MGAGSVGTYVGGCLAAAGVAVRFVGRARMGQALAAQGLVLTDLDGARRAVPAAALHWSADLPQALAGTAAGAAGPALVLLTVKSAGTVVAAQALGAALPAGTLVVSLQNGIGNAARAAGAAPALAWRPGLVPYNIAELGPGRLHRGTAGELAAEDDPRLRPWVPVFAAAGVPLRLVADLQPLQWGKLLLNLNNPVNALSGLPLRAQLLDAGYRRCFAALVEEALQVMAAAGIVPARVTPVPPRWLPPLLRMPTPLFRRLAARMLRIDAQARSSMADDLALGRPTEVDALSGEIVRLAAAHGGRAPRNAAMLSLLDPARPAPAPLPAQALWAAMQRG